MSKGSDDECANLVERMARAMQATNALMMLIDQRWETIAPREQEHWKDLAASALSVVDPVLGAPALRARCDV